MANDFTNLSSLVCLHDFESGALGTDSINDNDMTAYGQTAADSDEAPNQAANSYCVHFDGVNDCLYISDANLEGDTGVEHPLKSGEDTSWTVFGWVRFDSLTGQQIFIGKYDTNGSNRTFCIGKAIDTDANDANCIYVRIGTGTGATSEVGPIYDEPVVADRWYHFVYTHDKSGASEVGKLRLWDENGNDWLGGDADGWVNHTYVSDIYTGGTDYLAYGCTLYNTTPTWDFGGDLDEVGWCNAVVSDSDLEDIKDGEYGASSTTLIVASADHAQSADNVALTQANTLAVSDSSHAQSVDNISLSEAVQLVVAGSTHAQTADNVALTQASTLTAQGSDHAQTADNVVIVPQITGDSNFEAGNGTNFSISGNDVEFDCETETIGGTVYGYWFYVKLSNVDGTTPSITANMATSVSLSGIRPVYSFDQSTWVDVASSWSSGELTFDLPEISGNSEVWIAAAVPYTYTDLQGDITTWDLSSYVSVTDLGDSQQSRNVYYLEIDDAGSNLKKTDIVVTCRSHAGEPVGSWALKGMIDWILGETHDAGAYRAAHRIHVFPMVNPDGVYNGYSRQYESGVDANRDYDTTGPDATDEQDETFLVHTKIAAIESANSIDLAFDIHGSNEGPNIWRDSGDFSADLEAAIEGFISSYDTPNFWDDSFDEHANDTDTVNTTWRSGLYQQYGLNTFVVEGMIQGEGAFGWPDTDDIQAGGEVLLRAITSASLVNLTVADSGHAQTADNVALTQAATLTAQGSDHAQTADNVALTQASTLTVQGSTQSQSADNVTVSAEGGSTLTVQGSTQSQSAENVALTQANTLAVSDSSHAQSVDNISLSEAVQLVIAGSTHAHAVDNVDLTQAATLTVADSGHAQTVDDIALTQANTLAANSALHLHIAQKVNFQTAAGLVSITWTAKKPAAAWSTKRPAITFNV